MFLIQKFSIFVLVLFVWFLWSIPFHICHVCIRSCAHRLLTTKIRHICLYKLAYIFYTFKGKILLLDVTNVQTAKLITTLLTLCYSANKRDELSTAVYLLLTQTMLSLRDEQYRNFSSEFNSYCYLNNFLCLSNYEQ